jgi:hypothetical protein
LSMLLEEHGAARRLMNQRANELADL